MVEDYSANGKSFIAERKTFGEGVKASASQTHEEMAGGAWLD